MVIPNEDISDGDGSAAKCLYNETVFEGRLYTKRPKTYPAEGSDGADGGEGGEFQPWPYAVEMAQTVNMAPECHKTVSGKLGEMIEVAASGVAGGARADGGNGECECGYRNFGT
jgi:hypothetical protein